MRDLLALMLRVAALNLSQDRTAPVLLPVSYVLFDRAIDLTEPRGATWHFASIVI